MWIDRPWLLFIGCVSLVGCHKDPSIDSAECPELGDDRPASYHHTCTTNDDCAGSLECLPFPEDYDNGSPRTGEQLIDVCSMACSTARDCPQVETCHCGDQTVCEEGVCGYWMCI